MRVIPTGQTLGGPCIEALFYMPVIRHEPGGPLASMQGDPSGLAAPQ